MSITIGRLGSDDIADMKALLRVYGRAFEQEDVYGDRVPSADYLSQLLAKDDFITLVAREDSKVVAGLSGYVLQKFEQERSEIYIYDLAVVAEYRRRGIARGLIERLKSEAKRIGAYVIYVQADREDEAAVALYRSLGTEERPLHFDIEP